MKRLFRGARTHTKSSFGIVFKNKKITEVLDINKLIDLGGSMLSLLDVDLNFWKRESQSPPDNVDSSDEDGFDHY